MKLLKIIGSIFVLIFIAWSMFLFLKVPRADRTWLSEQTETATTSINGTYVTIHNLRDWTYDTKQPLTREWKNVTIDSSQIVRTWFLLEPFSDNEAIGHTFLSFELSDGAVYSFSVEARREEGESYSPLKGQFRGYELAYQWGTERDFVTRRVLYLNHPLRLYPLTLTEEQSQALFISVVEETQQLAEKPRFYNTLTANCTNVLAHIVNKHYPGTLPYDISWNLTGYADRYLMKQGLILTKDSKETTIAVHDLTQHRKEIESIATSSPELFSTTLRTLISL